MRNESIYLTKSQKIKLEIIQSGLVEKIENHFTGKSSLEEIGAGDFRRMYRVGQTDSGVWVALRDEYLIRDLYGGFTHLKDLQIFLLDKYAELCELKSQNNQRVSNFAIGGVYYTSPFLLVEDLTEGGSYDLLHEIINGKTEGGFREKDDTNEMVFWDFGPHGMKDIDESMRDIINSGKLDINQLKYFNPERIIRVD
jgi:hypothetical protein